ncbi:unnamed protein product, partial [Meganyctiphanes norvegica]
CASYQENYILESNVWCLDKHPGKCPTWAVRGDCRSNADYMTYVCPKSCGVCMQTLYSKETEETFKCADHHESCGSWAYLGECWRNPNYMNTYCPDTCNTCHPHHGFEDNICADHHYSCSEWAEHGECLLNPAFMSHNCPYSCNMCAIE